MESLNAQQIAFFTQELHKLCEKDATDQFLTYCVSGAQELHQSSLPADGLETFHSYVNAQRVLLQHREYLAYRLGLEHSKIIQEHHT